LQSFGKVASLHNSSQDRDPPLHINAYREKL